MSSNSLKLCLALVALPFFLASCANAQSIPNQDRRQTEVTATDADLSTDAGVIAELQRMIDAKNAAAGEADEKLAAKRRAASRLEPKDVCIQRLKESAKVIVVGFFRMDYGCYLAGAFVGSRYFEATEIELHQNALKALGWQRANRSERERLALVWVEKDLLAFFTVLYTDNDNRLHNVGFHPPEITTTENGDVKVRLWIQLPPTRSREKGFQHLEYRFESHGNFLGTSTLASVYS